MIEDSRGVVPALHGREFGAYSGITLGDLDRTQEGIEEFVATIEGLDKVDFSTTGLILYLYGEPATGKTTAALAGINYLVRREGDEDVGTIGPRRVAFTGIQSTYRPTDVGKKTRSLTAVEFDRDEQGVTGSTIFPEHYRGVDKTTNIALIDDYVPTWGEPNKDIFPVMVKEVYDKGGLLIVTSNTDDPAVFLQPTVAPDFNSLAMRAHLLGEDRIETSERSDAIERATRAEEERARVAQAQLSSRMQKIGQMIRPIEIAGKNWREGKNNWEVLGL